MRMPRKSGIFLSLTSILFTYVCAPGLPKVVAFTLWQAARRQLPKVLLASALGHREYNRNYAFRDELRKYSLTWPLPHSQRYC